MYMLAFTLTLLFAGLKASLLPPTPMVLLLADGRELTVKGDAPVPLVSFVLFFEGGLTGLTVPPPSKGGRFSFDNCLW